MADDGNDTLLWDEYGRLVDFLLPEDTKGEVRLVASLEEREKTAVMQPAAQHSSAAQHSLG